MGGQSTQIEIIGRHRRAVVQISHRSSPHRVGKSTLRDDSRIMPSPQRLTVTQTFVIVRELRQHSSATRNNPGLGIMTQIVQPHALDPGGFPDFRPLANLRPRVAGAVPEQQIGRIRPRQFFEFGDRLGAQRDDVALAAFAVFGRLRPAAADQVELALPRADKLTPPAPSNNNNLTATALRTSGHDPSTATNLPISSSDKYLSRLFSRFIEMLTHGLSTRQRFDREVESVEHELVPIRAGRFARFRQIEMQGLDVLDADVRDAVVSSAVECRP